jgi:hypothetical protein
MLGYKGFNNDLTCKGFQYEIGKTYTLDPQDIRLCYKGFHFCRIPIDVLIYYGQPESKYAVVRAEGQVINDSDKSVTNQITIIELMSKNELIKATTGLFVRKNNDKYWYQNGLLHRLDGPAIEFTDGNQEWYINNILHRDGGNLLELSLSTIEYADGDKE